MLSRYFVVKDLRMWDTRMRMGGRVNHPHLLDDLGQVAHAFIDKTGTLTENVMAFHQCYVQNQLYLLRRARVACSRLPVSLLLRGLEGTKSPCPRCLPDGDTTTRSSPF